MNEKLNALETAVGENNDSQIIHLIRTGLRISRLEVLANVENIQNKNALYLLMKYGIDEEQLDNVEKTLKNFDAEYDCSEALMIFHSKSFSESAPDPELKNAINERNFDVIEKCFDRNAKITELDTITFSIALSGYTDDGVRWLFRKALTTKSHCYFLMKLTEESKISGHTTIKRYADILEEMLAAYSSKDLENAITNGDQQGIVVQIAQKELLQNPELLTAEIDKINYIHAMMFLFEIGMTKAVKQQAIHLFAKKAKENDDGWPGDAVDLLQDSLKPFPETISNEELLLEESIRNADDKQVMELINKDVWIRRPDVIVDLAFTKLSVRTMIAVVTRALDFRVPPHVFKQISNIISYTEISNEEYNARIMVQNLILQYSMGNMTWENSQDVTSLYPMNVKSYCPPSKDDKKYEKLLNADLSDASEEEVSEALKAWKNALLECPALIPDFRTELIDLAEKYENWDDVRDLFNAVNALFDTKAFEILDHYKRIAFLKKHQELYVKFDLAALAEEDKYKILSFCEAITLETAQKIDWSVLGDYTFSWIMFLEIFPQLKDRCKCFDQFTGIEWFLIANKEPFREEYAEFLKRHPEEAEK